MIPSFLVSPKVKNLLMIFLFLSTSLIAEAAKNGVSLEDLLAAYLANHREIQALTIQLQQQYLSLESTRNSQGIDITLSTGNFSLGSSQVRGEPSISISMPRLNGTYLEARVPLQFDLEDNAAAKSSSQENASVLQGASLTVGTEILGNRGKSAELSVLKSERSLQEAQRRIQNQALAVEKEFYSTIKDLYSSYVHLLNLQNSVYTKELDLAILQAQGYGPTSTRYRTTQMEVLTNQRNVDKAQRSFQRELELFSQKCGLEADSLSITDFAPSGEILAATKILEELPVKGLESFTTMESAQWSLSLAELEERADSSVTLSAEAGYTYKGQAASSGASDTINGALVLKALGGTISTGVSVPLSGEEKNPAAQLSLTWSPNDMKNQSIQRQQRQLNLELAKLKIQEAEESYSQAMEETLLTWEDLLWSRQVAKEERELYQQLAQDTTSLFNQGMTTETEFKQANTNRDRAQIQCEIADLELIIHYIATRQLFIPEEN